MTPKLLLRRRNDGLVEGHAYSVLEVQEIYGVRLVRLRNPWGRELWNGAWSPGSPELRSNSPVALDARRLEGDGSFWMAYEDFAQIFTNVIVCPATMPLPKASRYAASSSNGAPSCGRCGRAMQSRWILAVREGPGRLSTKHRAHGWERFRDGDLCPLCLRATASRRRDPLRTGSDAEVVGLHGVELLRRIPGVDYFPFEAGAGCELPGKRPVCEHGPACTIHSPLHFVVYDHPWMRPGPEEALGRSGAKRGWNWTSR